MKQSPYLLLFIIFYSTLANSFVFYEDTKIWNQESITFYFLDGTSQQKDEVIKFAKLWERYSGIKFKYSSKKPSIFDFNKYYEITFKGDANESTQGAINGIIHLGKLSDNIIFRKTTILHEFGHMLGLGHEHQRADRPNSLNNPALIKSCIDNQLQSKQWCQENLFNKNTKEVFVKSKYDSKSIMHYEMDNITGEKNKANNYTLWDNTHSLSYTDKYFIAMLYNQNISDRRLERMHKQDLWQQQKFEEQANKAREKAILNLSTSSCAVLKYQNQSKDGKYCDAGFMIIGKDGLSFPDPEFKTCYVSYRNIKDKMDRHQLCDLNAMQLSNKRELWRNEFSQYGNCKRLETNEKNNQEYSCTEGYSFVTFNNDLIGKKTLCYSSEESAYLAMKDNRICNLDKFKFISHQRQMKEDLKKRMKNDYCQVVKKKYSRINCPVDYDYTIINIDIKNRPINNKCFASKYQAINAMQLIPFCQS